MIKRLFTLIELIVIIVVLGILAAIVIPNISNIKDDATKVSISSNEKSIQTAIDAFSLENNGNLPVFNDKSSEFGKPIDLSKLHPSYIRNLPQDKDMKYWVDNTGSVWASSVDSPKRVSVKDSELSWDTVEGAVKYNIYSVEDSSLTGTASVEKINYVDSVTRETTYPNVDSDKLYLVSAIDKHGLESLPAGSNYNGYPKPLLEGNHYLLNGFDEYISLPREDFSQLEFGEISGEAWVYWKGINGNNNAGGIWGAYDLLGNETNNHFEITRHNEIRLRVGDVVVTSPTNTISPNEWYYVSFSYDPNEESINEDGEAVLGVARIYLNGELIAEGYGQSNTVYINQTGGDYPTHAIGKTYERRHFYGYISEFRLWNKPLSQKEMLSNMNKDDFSKDDGLVGYWKLNNMKNGQVEDLSDNNNHGFVDAFIAPQD